MTLVTGPRVRLMGDLLSPELAPAVAWLRAHAHCENDDASRQVEPAAIVLCLARPGRISQNVVEKLHRQFPLTQLMVLAGPWCEGEVRSGRPWPGVTRIYWHQWPTRLLQEFQRLELTATPRLPRSATEVDVLLSRPTPRQLPRPSLIGVTTSQQSDFEAVALALAAGGHHPVWLIPGDALPVLTLDLILVDAAGDLAAAIVPWQALVERIGPVPSIVLAHFPRPEELSAIRESSRMAVLAKPYFFDDLLDRVQALLGSRTEELSASAAA